MSKKISFTYENKDYTLEYTLRTIKTMEDRGFRLDAIDEKPATVIPMLFHGAFLRHHRGIDQRTTEKIYAGMTHKNDLVKELIGMYQEALEALLDDDEDEGDEGNANWTLS
jgi:hypothetical protein